MRSQATSSGTAIESKIRRALPHLYAWYRKNHRPLPWRTRPTAYRTAVAEFMCQQTRITTVIPYYHRWMQAFPGWDRLAKASFSRVLRMWEGLGYYRRARFLHALAKAVVQLPGKDLPPHPEALRRLPGIGDYTAGAIASIAFGKPAPAFDGNVARVLGRLAARQGKSPDLAFLRALAGHLVPRRNAGLHNQALMELGALVCLPGNPRCPACPLQSICPSSRRLPDPGRPKSAPSRKKENILVVRKGDRIWLTRNHPQGRWQGLDLLPTQNHRPPGKPSLQICYPFTRFLIQASVFTGQKPPRGVSGTWVSPVKLRRATLPAPHRKILTQLGFG